MKNRVVSIILFALIWVSTASAQTFDRLTDGSSLCGLTEEPELLQDTMMMLGDWQDKRNRGRYEHENHLVALDPAHRNDDGGYDRSGRIPRDVLLQPTMGHFNPLNA